MRNQKRKTDLISKARLDGLFGQRRKTKIADLVIKFLHLLVNITMVLVLGFPVITLGSASISPHTKESTHDFDGSPTPNVIACPPLTGPDGNSPYLFGVINDEGQHYVDEWARGVRATTFELQWRLYEPAEGVYDIEYITHMQDSLEQLKAQGWYVQLIPGYHYAPDWVFSNYPDMYYINQYGDRYDPDSQTQASYRVINAPFNPQARALIAGYIARVFQDFDPTQFDSVRTGGGVQGELRFPPASSIEHFNSYWAFDDYAQNPGVSGIPAEILGWRPGIDPNPGSQGHGQLIVNPGFEQAHSYIPILAWSPDDEISAQLTEQDPHSGEHALELILQTPNRIHQYIRVEPEKTYHFNGWLKSNGVGKARLFVSQYDSDTQLVEVASFKKIESEQTTWILKSGTLTTSPTTRYLKVELDGDRPGTYYFDDLSLSLDGEIDARERDISVPLAFYDWYVQELTDYQNWQISEITKYTSKQLDLVLAGKGILPNHLNDALANDLSGDGWSEKSRALYGASVYDRHVANLTGTENIALYLTGIEDPPKEQIDDVSPYPGDWSAAHWLSDLASKHSLIVWGENTGQNSDTQMRLALERMYLFGFSGLMWGFESELYPGTDTDLYASIEYYEEEIIRYSSQCRVFVPIVQ